VVPTTSRPRRPSRSKASGQINDNPIKGISLKVIVTGPGHEDLARRASEKGLGVEKKGHSVTISLHASTAEDALAQMELMTGLLAQKA